MIMNIVDIVLDAGKLLKSHFEAAPKAREKERLELVSETDAVVEDLLIERLRSTFGEVGIYSEERGPIEANSPIRWILDPLDGTANFVAGVPYFAVSAAKEVDGKIVEGYVHNPISGEFYSAVAGSGQAMLNGARIAPSHCTTVAEALIGFGFSANMTKIERYHAEWRRVFDTCRKGLPLIVPSLTLCNVARGRLDAFIDFGCSTEGQAAAALIVSEAGGVVRNYDLSPHNYRVEGAVACAPGLVAGLLPANRRAPHPF